MSATGRLLVLLIALAGLIAMHGLSDHGAAGRLAGATSTSMVSSHGSAMSHDPTGAVRASGAEVTAVAVTGPGAGDREDPGDDHRGHDRGMAGLCLAVLVAAFLLLTGHALGGHILALSGTSHLVAVTRLRNRARVPDPPDLLRLSIQRC